jgi:hypothetical protein
VAAKVGSVEDAECFKMTVGLLGTIGGGEMLRSTIMNQLGRDNGVRTKIYILTSTA